MYEKHTYNPYRNNIAIIKEYFKSPLVLALAIAHIVSVIIGLVNAIVSSEVAKNFMRQLSEFIDKNLVLQNVDTDLGNNFMKAIRDALSQPDAATTTLSIPIFTILTIVGLLLLFFSCRKNDLNSAPTAGVTILNILAILALVGYILVAVCMLAIAVALFIIYATFQSHPTRAFSIHLGTTKLEIDATVILIVAIAFTVVAAICSFIMLFYAISRKRYIGSIKKSLTSVELSRAGAKPFGIFTVIIAAFTGLGLLTSVTDLVLSRPSQEVLNGIGITFTYTGTTIMTILSIASQATAFVIAVLQAKIALGYAKYIDEKRSGYIAPSDTPSSAEPVNTGVGVHTSSTPYSYLAQPKTEELDKADSFVNPYADKTDQPSE